MIFLEKEYSPLHYKTQEMMSIPSLTHLPPVEKISIEVTPPPLLKRVDGADIALDPPAKLLLRRKAVPVLPTAIELPSMGARTVSPDVGESVRRSERAAKRAAATTLPS